MVTNLEYRPGGRAGGRRHLPQFKFPANYSGVTNCYFRFRWPIGPDLTAKQLSWLHYCCCCCRLCVTKRHLSLCSQRCRACQKSCWKNIVFHPCQRACDHFKAIWPPCGTIKKRENDKVGSSRHIESDSRAMIADHAIQAILDRQLDNYTRVSNLTRTRNSRDIFSGFEEAANLRNLHLQRNANSGGILQTMSDMISCSSWQKSA